MQWFLLVLKNHEWNFQDVCDIHVCDIYILMTSSKVLGILILSIVINVSDAQMYSYNGTW